MRMAMPCFPLRLRHEGQAIVGEIGHAARRFLPVEPDEASITALQGRWFAPEQRAELVVEGKVLMMGIGPAAIPATLQSLGQDRVLATGKDGPWQKRFVIQRQGERIRLQLSRSRVVYFQRSPT